jgi:prepilin-type N-terminal cleavage/methylation domain-containing protein
MPRRGYLLIEMLVALTVGAVILGIGVGMLHMLLRTEQTGRNRVPQARIVARLAEQFRSDVAAATNQTSGPQKTEWRFEMAGDRVVTYRASPGEVERDERIAGKLVRHESYVLPSGCSAAIAVQRKATPAVVSLVIADNSPPQATGHELHIIAVLGKDHRFMSSPIGGQ